MEKISGFLLTKSAIETEGLTLRQKMILVVIASHADGKGLAYPSLETIAREACVAYKRDRIIETINELVDLRLLQRMGYVHKNRLYKVLQHVPKAGTCHTRKQAPTVGTSAGKSAEDVPIAGTSTCTHSGDTNIPSNLPPTSNLKPSAEGGDIIPSVTKEEYFDALAAKQSAEGKVKRKERYIQQLKIFAKRLHGKRAEDIATIIAQEQMRKAELEIRLKRAERAIPS